MAECFRSEARSTALAVAIFTNWMANLVLTLFFPYMAKALGDYTFLVFAAIVALAVAVIIIKVRNEHFDKFFSPKSYIAIQPNKNLALFRV